MFGNWLFGVVAIKDGGYESGKAVAMESLCKIFSYPQRRNPFTRTYLERFYAVLIEGLRSDIHTLASILSFGENLAIMQLEGIKVIFPDLLIALRRILDLPAVFFFPRIIIWDRGGPRLNITFPVGVC